MVTFKTLKDSCFIEFSSADEANKFAELKTVKVNDKDITILSKQEYFEKKKAQKKAKKRGASEDGDNNNNNADEGNANKKRKFEEGNL